jgi:hypothetical protein
VAKKPEGWSETIIQGWCQCITGREDDGNELEYPISRILSMLDNGEVAGFECEEIGFRGRRGNLYITDCSTLLAQLHSLNLRDNSLPKDPRGLGRRLRSRPFKGFELLDEKNAPEVEPLTRETSQRRIGFFKPDD